MNSSRAVATLALFACPVSAAVAFPKLPMVERPRVDRFGDPLPERALARLGSARFRHPGPIHAVAYSPDGRLVAASSATPTVVRIWDRASGQLLDQWRFTDRGAPEQLVFSPDSKRLYAGRLSDRHRPWAVRDVERKIGADIGPVLEQSADCQTLLPDGRHAAAVTGDNVVCWDLNNDRQVAIFKRPDKRIGGLGLDPDLGWVAIGHDGTHYSATRLSDQKPMWSVKGDWDGILPNQPAAFTNDGKQVAIRTEAGRIHVLETSSGKAICQIKGVENGAVGAMTFAREGRILAVAWKWKGVRLYDLPDGVERARLGTACGSPMSLAFAPDSKSIATADPEGPRSVLFFDAERGGQLDPVPGHTTPISSVGISPDGTTVATAGSAGGEPLLAVWSANDGRRKWTSNDGRVSDFAFSPDGSILATPIRVARHPIRLWDLQTGRVVADLESGEPGGSLAFGRNGRLVGGIARRIQFWDTKKREPEPKTIHLPKGVDRIVLAPDGREAFASTPEIYACNLASGHVGETVIPLARTLTGLSLSPDGRLLAAADGGNIVRIWEVLTWDVAATIEFPDPVAGIAFSPAGHTLAVATSAGTILYGLPNAGARSKLVSSATPDTVVAFSSNGRRLVTAGNRESTATVWDVADMIECPTAKLSKNDCESCWTDLLSPDPKVGYAAAWKLATHPETSVPFLAAEFQRVLPDARRIARLIADLNDAKYVVRERAMRELMVAGNASVGALRAALNDKKVSAEQAERIEELLKKLDGPKPAPARLRESRAVAALELMGGPKARALLEELATRPQDSSLSQNARAALDRTK
jgi:WD40 repeat protein